MPRCRSQHLAHKRVRRRQLDQVLPLRLRRLLPILLLLLTTFLMTSLDGASTVLLRSLGAIFLLIPWAPPSAEPLVLFPTPNYVVCVSAPLHAKFPVFCVR